jgi:hypothetical protein
MNGARRARPPRLDAGAVISVRLAADGDDVRLARLAELSGAVRPAGLWLVAEVDGQLWAALPLAGGDALADPFRPTAEVQALLALRARQLGREEPERDGSPRGRRRLRSTLAFADP